MIEITIKQLPEPEDMDNYGHTLTVSARCECRWQDLGAGIAYAIRHIRPVRLVQVLAEIVNESSDDVDNLGTESVENQAFFEAARKVVEYWENNDRRLGIRKD